MTIRTVRAVVAAFITAAALSACANTKAPAPNYIASPAQNAASANRAQCAQDWRAMTSRIDASDRHARIAEAAYIATHNETVAKKNIATSEANVARDQADMASYKKRCGNWVPLRDEDY